MDAMARKQVLFRSAAREKILRGATQLADAIRVTLGPRSKAVLIEKKWGAADRVQRRRHYR
jgi:chaperonin GroEL